MVLNYLDGTEVVIGIRAEFWGSGRLYYDWYASDAKPRFLYTTNDPTKIKVFDITEPKHNTMIANHFENI